MSAAAANVEVRGAPVGGVGARARLEFRRLSIERFRSSSEQRLLRSKGAKQQQRAPGAARAARSGKAENTAAKLIDVLALAFYAAFIDLLSLARLRAVSSGVVAAPQIRANWAKFTVRSAKRAPEPLRGALLAAIPDALRAEIREAGALDWLSARVFVELCEAIRAGAGALGARAFWRQSLRDAIRQPFMQPLARGALFLWGKTPTALVRRTPQAWQLVSRNCGELKAIESGEQAAITLRVEQLPTSCRKQGLLLMWEGGLMAQLDAVDAEGSVQARTEQFASLGSVDFIVQWSRPA